jgi:hypothetical protein
MKWTVMLALPRSDCAGTEAGGDGAERVAPMNMQLNRNAAAAAGIVLVTMALLPGME